MYKIISKIIVNRLRPLLDKCIALNQGTFVPRRCIFENILIAHELFNSFNKKKSKLGSVAIKIDLEKAYDFLNWDYIKYCLTRFGFHDRQTNIIMNCITSVSFSLLVNGKPYGNFIPSCGIRQGDPLSPYLFISFVWNLLFDILIYLLLLLNLKLVYYLLCMVFEFLIQFLLMTVFCLQKLMGTAAKNIKNTLNLFSLTSGQQINFHKSTCYFSNNVSRLLKDDFYAILGILISPLMGSI